jgi:hypothetical protein
MNLGVERQLWTNRFTIVMGKEKTALEKTGKMTQKKASGK